MTSHGTGKRPTGALEAAQRARNLLRSRVDYLLFVYGSAVRWSIAVVVSVVLLVGDLLPKPWSSVIFWGGVALAVLALAQTVVTGVRTFVHWSSVTLVPRPEPFRWGGAQWTDDGRIVPISPGDAPQLAWQSPEVDELLRRTPAFRSAVPASLDAYPFQLPRRLADIAGRSLRHRAARNAEGGSRRLPPARFNGRLVRLASEPTPEALSDGGLVFQHVRYYDGESSNEVWPFVPKAEQRGRRRSPVEPFVVDRRHRILSLDLARAANIVGISMFAVTADDRIILVRQSARNSVAPDAFASSSSGSADPGDFGFHHGGRSGGTGALAGLMTGMLRELAEESRVRREEVVDDSAVITGYFRWLDRGAKPEFTGLARVRVASTELDARGFHDGESAFTAGLAFLPVTVALDAVSAWREDASTPELRQRAAVDRFVGEIEHHCGSAAVNPSCAAAWCAAIDYLATHPEWLETGAERGDA